MNRNTWMEMVRWAETTELEPEELAENVIGTVTSLKTGIMMSNMAGHPNVSQCFDDLDERVQEIVTGLRLGGSVTAAWKMMREALPIVERLDGVLAYGRR